MANKLGLNIQYPWDIEWVPTEGKPIGLFALAGWIEDRFEEIERAEREAELKARGFTEVHYSDTTELSEDDDAMEGFKYEEID